MISPQEKSSVRPFHAEVLEIRNGNCDWLATSMALSEDFNTVRVCARHDDNHSDSGWSTCDTGSQVSMPGRQQRSSARILPSAK
jgi:hypothetical protein